MLPGTTLKATSAENSIVLTGLIYITVIPADPSAGRGAVAPAAAAAAK